MPGVRKTVNPTYDYDHRSDFCNTYRLKKGSLVQSLTADRGIVCRQHQYTRKHHESSHWPRCWESSEFTNHNLPERRYVPDLCTCLLLHSAVNHPIRWSARSCLANETNCLLLVMFILHSNPSVTASPRHLLLHKGGFGAAQKSHTVRYTRGCIEVRP